MHRADVPTFLGGGPRTHGAVRSSTQRHHQRSGGQPGGEALEDLGEFTRLDTLAVSEDDEEEMEALTELEEYMRVAVITIHQDMLPK